MTENTQYETILHPTLALKEDRNSLLDWSRIQGKPYIKLLGISFYNMFHPISRKELQLGTLVNISLMMQSVETDGNMDGDLTEAEKLAAEDKNQNMIDQFTSCVGTCGVIGALVFSGLCSTVLNPLNPSESSLYYFGDNVVDNLTLAYYAFIYSAFLLSCYVVINSFLIFLAVTIWMPNRDLRCWYIRKGSAMLRLLFGAGGTILFTAISMALAVAVNVSPKASLISVILLAVLLVMGFGEYSHLAAVSSATLHRYCREKLFANEFKCKDPNQKKGLEKESNDNRDNNGNTMDNSWKGRTAQVVPVNT